MKSRIKKTLRNIVLVGTGLAGSLGLISNSGCDSYGNPYGSTQAAAGSVAAQHIATTNPNLTPNQAQGFGALGSLLGMVSQQEAMREAARETNSSNIRVEAITPETHPQHYRKTENKRKLKEPLVFTSKKDIVDYAPGEERDYTKIFYPGELIKLCGGLYKIFPAGTPVANQTTYLKTGRKLSFTEKNKIKEGCYKVWQHGADFLLNNYGEGEYENTWYVKLDGKWKEVGRCSWVIIDNRNYKDN